MKKLVVFITVSIFLTLSVIGVAQEIDEETAKNLFLNPSKMGVVIWNMVYDDERMAHINDQIIAQIDDKEFLLDMFQSYETSNGEIPAKVRLLVMACLLKNLKADQEFFKRVYERNRKSHIYISSAALIRVDDYAFVRKVIIETGRTKGSTLSSNPASEYLKARGDEIYNYDPDLIDWLSQYSPNDTLRLIAINTTGNMRLLCEIADTKNVRFKTTNTYPWFYTGMRISAAKSRLNELPGGCP